MSARDAALAELGPLEGLSKLELLELRDKLEADKREVKAQVDGYRSGPTQARHGREDWYRRAEGALRWKLAQIAAVAAEVRARNELEKQELVSRERCDGKLFQALVKERLGENAYLDLWDEVERRRGTAQ